MPAFYLLTPGWKGPQPTLCALFTIRKMGSV